jgi:hypothetical protein
LPTLPEGAPTHLEHLLDDIERSLELDAPGTSLRALKSAFAYLCAYFADVLDDLTTRLLEVNFEGKTDEPTEAVETISNALALFYKDEHRDLPEVKLLLDIFIEGKKSKTFARLLGIKGKPPRGTVRLDKFISSKPPARRKSLQEIRRYLPFLSQWLEAATPLFLLAATRSARTDDQGRQSIFIQLGSREVTIGERLRVHGCHLCIPQKEIVIPASLYPGAFYLFVPQKVPIFLTTILDRLEAETQKEDPVTSCRELGSALEFLIRYFAAVTSKVCEDLKCLPKIAQALVENSESVSASEKLLSLCLDELRKQPDSKAAVALTKIFYRRNEFFEFVPRWHTEVLALRGQLSGWCQLEPGEGDHSDPEVCRLEFENHLPTLSAWLQALGGYLTDTEHFFNKPSAKGSVEFSLRIGDRFIEVGEPGYLLWLNNPRVESDATGAQTGPSRPLIRVPIDIPESTPKVLSRILTRMDIYLRLGDAVESCISMRDAIDYLTRYFAGLAVAAFKQLGDVPEEVVSLAQSSLSVHECEKLLLLALESIGTESDEQLGKAIRNVFYYTEELSQGEKPTGAHSRLLALDADPSNKIHYLADFCSLKPGEGVLSHPARSRRELERFLPPLQDWLAMAEPLFKQCRHFEEPPGKDGKTELVIEFNDIYLELVAPDYIFYIIPGSDVVPDIDAPELPPLDEVVDYDLIDQVAIRKSATRDKPFLVHRVELIGDRENSRGVVCQAGYIILTNAGTGSLSGEAVSTYTDAIEVEPRRFRGNKVQLSYWVNTQEVPDTHEIFIELKTAQGRRSVSVFEMIGQARKRPISAAAGLFKMASAMAASVSLFLLVFLFVCFLMDRQLTAELTSQYVNLELLREVPQAYFQVAGYSHLVGYLYLLMAGLVPVIVGRIFRGFPPSTQELLQDRRRFIMALPSVVVGLGLLTPILRNHFTTDADFPAMNLRHLYLYFIGLNLASTYYQELSLTERFDDLLVNRDLVKWLPQTIAWVTFATIILLGVSG